MEQLPPPIARDDIDAVQRLLATLGERDDAFLHHVIGSLLEWPPDSLRPTVALLIARALGRPADEETIRFAATVQVVFAAALAHRVGMNGLDERRDQVTVLAGDYLYAQAAMITARLQRLDLMAMLAETLKRICRDDALYALDNNQEALRDAVPYGLFSFAAAGAALLAGADHRTAATLGAFGTALDDLANRHPGSAPDAALQQAEPLLAPLPAGGERDALLAIARHLSQPLGHDRAATVPDR